MTKERNQCLRLKAAKLKMHKPDTFLMKMHTNTGTEYFIVPGGRVRSDDAAKIIARPDVVPHSNGLFPGIEQAWKLVR
jgi:MOSC domain-containing protein YiiM